jgi:hypothetical protein
MLCPLPLIKISITYIVYWYKTLYQVEPVLWTSITTGRELWCCLFTQHTRPNTKSCTNWYAISVSNISIKPNFEINKFVQYYEGDYIFCMTSRYLLPFLHQCHVTAKSLSVSLYNRSTTSFYYGNVGRTVAGNIEILSLDIIICLRCLFWCAFPRISMIWRHDNVVRQKGSRTTSRHYSITTVWWYNTLSDGLRSLISKRNVENIK